MQVHTGAQSLFDDYLESTSTNVHHMAVAAVDAFSERKLFQWNEHHVILTWHRLSKYTALYCAGAKQKRNI
jgi:hypothetical protein